ncbi:protein vein isoform X2 [Neocloeon triangulifer]|uniref:protein vein isoform X2 n=1 Tax=Neocloeon triangulifer TaxID=2078957 RepID=UPI00286F0AC9|nr:protein vein isoform X2 [Neocloeon triangulifer]XP_059475956.1 protein vein isoform X2 [Neocloeon triangulifer]
MAKLVSGPRAVIRQVAAAEMKPSPGEAAGRTEKVWWCRLLLVVLMLVTVGVDAATATTPLLFACSAKQSRVLQFEDAGAKAFLSPVVFKGLVKSRTPVDARGLYEASFLIVQPLKGFAHPTPKKRRRRLQLAAPNAGAACRHGAVAALVDVNSTYLVFADRASQHQFRPLAPPLPATKRHEDAVDRVLCRTCEMRPPSVTGLQNVTVRARLKLKLTCQYDGSPPPLIEWYKRGRRIEPSKRTKIVNKKRRSVLTIARVSKSDAGKYECRAVSVTDEKVSASAHVTVTNEQTPSRPDNSTTLWPLVNTLCPINSYCLNGGTCLYYEAVGELVCECAEGFKGKRCENKDVYNKGSSRGKGPLLRGARERSASRLAGRASGGVLHGLGVATLSSLNRASVWDGAVV